MREPLRANLPAALGKVFEEFRVMKDPELEKALTQAMKFCADMASANQHARWLTLLGPSGTGKTMLAKCVRRFFSRYLEPLLDERNGPGEMFRRRGGFKSWLEAVNAMLQGDYTGIPNMKNDWFLVLDDIGTEHIRNRELSTSKLLEILNAREGRFTVITANIPLQEISEKLDARIASRLMRNGGAVVSVDTEDFNLR